MRTIPPNILISGSPVTLHNNIYQLSLNIDAGVRSVYSSSMLVIVIVVIDYYSASTPASLLHSEFIYFF